MNSVESLAEEAELALSSWTCYIMELGGPYGVEMNFLMKKKKRRYQPVLQWKTCWNTVFHLAFAHVICPQMTWGIRKFQRPLPVILQHVTKFWEALSVLGDWAPVFTAHPKLGTVMQGICCLCCATLLYLQCPEPGRTLWALACSSEPGLGSRARDAASSCTLPLVPPPVPCKSTCDGSTRATGKQKKE